MKDIIIIKRTNSDNKAFQELVKALDLDLKIRDGEKHLILAELNKTDKLKYVIVAYNQETVVGCGALKKYSENIMEIKRMFVQSNKRGQGIASTILTELEIWCQELNFIKCILETGRNQPEAIRLYVKNNYKIIPNFGKYQNVDNSICFEKTL